MAYHTTSTDRGDVGAASSDTVNERVGVVNPDGDDDDIEVLLVDVVEAWEMETCTCRAAGRTSRPLLRIIPGEARLRCSECLRPYIPLPGEAPSNWIPLLERHAALREWARGERAREVASPGEMSRLR